MKNRILGSICFMLLMALPMQAELVKCLIVQLTDETMLYYPIADKPIATFEGNVMHLNTNAMEMTTIAKLTVKMVELTVALKPDVNVIEQPINTNQTLYLHTTQQDIQIFNLAGKVVKTSIAKQGELFTIDLTQLPAGFYILKAGVNTWKFMKH